VHQIAPAELGECQKLEKYFMSLIVAAGLNSLVVNEWRYGQLGIRNHEPIRIVQTY
jgi:hypothetical protein